MNEEIAAPLRDVPLSQNTLNFLFKATIIQCIKKKYCFVIRSVLASSNMPTSEQLAIATAEALGAVDSATESGKVFNALSQINVLKPPAYLVKLLNSHFFVN